MVIVPVVQAEFRVVDVVRRERARRGGLRLDRAPLIPQSASWTRRFASGSAAASPPPDPDGSVAPAFDRARFRRLFVAVMVPMFLAAVDQTMLATATPVISRELGGLRDTSWLAVAYLLAAVVMVPLYGRLGDRYRAPQGALDRDRRVRARLARLRPRADARPARRRTRRCRGSAAAA